MYFLYSVSGEKHALCLRDGGGRTELLVDGEACDLQPLFSAAALTSSMQQLCLTWTSSSGLVGVYFRGSHRTSTCSGTVGESVPAGGELTIGGETEPSGSNCFGVTSYRGGGQLATLSTQLHWSNFPEVFSLEHPQWKL